MYRVYDTKKKRWVKESIYLSPNNDLSTSTKALFGAEKLSLVSNQRYILHKDIGLQDINGKFIFEGDIAKVEINDESDQTTTLVTGLVAYHIDHASYYLFDYLNSKYYPLNSDICKYLEVIGNIFDNDDLLPS